MLTETSSAITLGIFLSTDIYYYYDYHYGNVKYKFVFGFCECAIL